MGDTDRAGPALRVERGTASEEDLAALPAAPPRPSPACTDRTVCLLFVIHLSPVGSAPRPPPARRRRAHRPPAGRRALKGPYTRGSWGDRAGGRRSPGPVRPVAGPERK